MGRCHILYELSSIGYDKHRKLEYSFPLINFQSFVPLLSIHDHQPMSAVLRIGSFRVRLWRDCSRPAAVPRLYGDKLPAKVISPRARKVQRRIVVLHDFFRTKVVPPASNMLSMVSEAVVPWNKNTESVCSVAVVVVVVVYRWQRGRCVLICEVNFVDVIRETIFFFSWQMRIELATRCY